MLREYCRGLDTLRAFAGISGKVQAAVEDTRQDICASVGNVAKSSEGLREVGKTAKTRSKSRVSLNQIRASFESHQEIRIGARPIAGTFAPVFASRYLCVTGFVALLAGEALPLS